MGVFLDLAKAFDTVSADLLLRKMEASGIRGLALSWFHSYLSNRQQYVKIGDLASDLLPISFGVPQGSILGPTLFNLYINDLLYLPLTNGQIISYADDTVIIFHAKTWEKVYHYAEIGLRTIAETLNKNLLTLNLNKTKIINFHKTSKSKPPQHLLLKYHTCPKNNVPNKSCNCSIVDQTDCIKYLGITVDSNLSFKTHIRLLANRTRKLIYVVKALRDCTPPSTLRTVYFALCQSTLQYGIALWGGAAKSVLMELERAQRAVLKVMLKKSYRYSTDLLYQESSVLRVRQIFILKATLLAHKCVKSRSDYQRTIRRRIYRIPCPRADSLLARRCPFFLHPHIYNAVLKHCNLKDLSYFTCKNTVKKWLLSLSYASTEMITNVSK